MQWLRWYRGTTEDAKFRVTARNAGVTVRDVIAVWALLLEDASDDKHRGVVHKDEDWIQTVLDFEDGVAESILAAMQDAKMISVGHGAITVINWDKRQFEGDADRTNAERQRRWRERNKPVTRDGNERNALRNRYSNAPEDRRQKTETEKNTPSVCSARARATKPTRWPPDAIVPDDWKRKAAAKRAERSKPPIDVDTAADQFANWAVNAPTRVGLKTDWYRAWENWVLKEDSHAKSRGSGQLGQSLATDVFGGVYARARAEREGS